MSILVKQDDDDRAIITVAYRQPWTWQEFDAAVAELNALLSQADGLVDLIFDVQGGGFPPPGAIEHFKQALKQDHSHIRQLVFVGGRHIVIGLLGTIFRVYGRIHKLPYMRFVTSKEEAYKIIAHQRSRARGGQKVKE